MLPISLILLEYLWSDLLLWGLSLLVCLFGGNSFLTMFFPVSHWFFWWWWYLSTFGGLFVGFVVCLFFTWQTCDWKPPLDVIVSMLSPCVAPSHNCADPSNFQCLCEEHRQYPQVCQRAAWIVGMLKPKTVLSINDSRWMEFNIIFIATSPFLMITLAGHGTFSCSSVWNGSPEKSLALATNKLSPLYVSGLSKVANIISSPLTFDVSFNPWPREQGY